MTNTEQAITTRGRHGADERSRAWSHRPQHARRNPWRARTGAALTVAVIMAAALAPVLW